MIASIINQNTIYVYDLTQFDIYTILHSGQVFRYWKLADGWLLMSGNHWAKIKSQSEQIIIECDDARYFYNFFDFDTDYQEIKKSLMIPKLANALQHGAGIRILKANFVEIVFSFIISANNNIKRFTKTLNCLCEEFGNLTSCGYHGFPNLKQLENISLEDFKRLGCGYRSEYLVTAAQQLKSIDYKYLQHLSNIELQHELMKIKGVGPKVAACIMLFAFHRLDVAPVDTWIRKAITQMSDNEREIILQGQYAGVAQQYIFYYLQHLQKQEL